MVWAECGSAFNFDRAKLGEMLDGILAGKYDGSVCLIENKDRWMRMASPICERICRAHNIRVIYTAQTNLNDDEMWTNDIISFITYHAAKQYSGRASERKKKEPSPECIARGKALLDAGISSKKIHEILQAEGYEQISQWTARKYIYLQREKLSTVIPDIESSGVDYRKECTVLGESGDRLLNDILYSHYEKWCIASHRIQMSRRKFLAVFIDCKMTRVGNKTTALPFGAVNRTALCGIRIKGEKLHMAVKTRERTTKTSPLDRFLTFYSEQLRGKELLGRVVVEKYRAYLKAEQITDEISHEEIYKALTMMGAIKQIKGRGFLYKMV